MGRVMWGVVCLGLLFSLGCSITNYPVITDSRGDYSGVIRTAHKAYIIPTMQVATIYSDGSEETFTTVYQNQYADRRLYSFANFDPTASVIFLDQTYCDWRNNRCAYMTSDDPHQDWLDDPFDLEEWDRDCPGAKSTCFMISMDRRIGECGDWLATDMQNMAAEFAQLPTTSFRGEQAYVLPVNPANTTITLTSPRGAVTDMPIYGSFTGVITSDLQVVIPMTPNTRLEMGWLRQHLAAAGEVQHVELTYGSLNTSVDVKIRSDALSYNMGRF